MSRLATVGEVGTVRGEPPDGNPWRAYRNDWTPRGAVLPSISGDERVAALRVFRDGRPVGDVTFWLMRDGDTRRLTDPAEVDWSGMRDGR